MASKLVKIELNRDGIGALLKGPETREMVERFGDEVAQRAGTGYAARTHNSGQRHICNVYAATPEARQDNLENNTLIKAMGNLPGRPKK